MTKVTSIEKVRNARMQKAADGYRKDGFIPCDQDMTICGDCEKNRAQKKCPRLKEWLAQRQ